MLSYFTLYLFPIMLLIAAAYDVGSFRIPNWVSLAMLASFVPLAILAGMPYAELGMSLAAGAGMLVVGMALFAFKVVGGGDAKLLAASALWIGLGNLMPFVIAVAIVGGLFGLALIMFRRMPLPATLIGQEWIARLHASEQGIPYGVAICIGGIMTFPETGIYRLLVG